MPRLSQTAAEKAYFQLFAQHYSLPEGTIVFGDKPDVRILGAKSIGIEIANLHKQDGSDPKTEKAQAVFRTEVIELAERLFRESGEKCIELWIDFDPEYPIVNVKRSAKILAEIAREISRQGGDHNSYKAFDNAPELRFITCNGIQYANAKWHPVQTHDVPSLGVDRVRALVAQKGPSSFSVESNNHNGWS